ncbi:putative WRKY family transcription factor [Melia azedarach]|uniref:WRKY family transcription factor n=1 Tax=Melia azedarach TaxID=155640 RepID=A0ACC1XL21_MELAZ|nr:putative WRKY family transcription factor [Melia azedarach]
MSDFVCMDWDLQAIVRGCSSELSTPVMDIPRRQSCFPPPSLQQDVFFKFPDICESTTIFDELEQLYKPFYPQTTITSTTSMSVPLEVKKPKKMRKPRPVSISANGTINIDEAAQPKKGKNQQKRVVQQVTDALSCDMWAWRKYGQKPIKGSPYPRSYYRCSSSKGCLARKQVERSSTDPGQFIITYSAEHNHTHPIRRSSLAGSTRSKTLMRSTVPAATSQPADQAQTVLSPITPLARSIEDEFVQENIKKGEEGNVFENGGEEVMPDLSDELFSSLQDLEDLLFDQFTEDISDDKTWFIDESATIPTQGL